MLMKGKVRTGQAHRTLVGHTGPVSCVQFDEVHLVSGSLDKSIRVRLLSLPPRSSADARVSDLGSTNGEYLGHDSLRTPHHRTPIRFSQNHCRSRGERRQGNSPPLGCRSGLTMNRCSIERHYNIRNYRSMAIRLRLRSSDLWIAIWRREGKTVWSRFGLCSERALLQSVVSSSVRASWRGIGRAWRYE